MPELILDAVKKHPNWLIESAFRKRFSEQYKEITEMRFPPDFKFNQKVYHWIYGDTGLLIGICPECGKRCGFRNFNYGYNEYCCAKCANNSGKKKNDIKRSVRERYDVDCSLKSESVKNKIKETNLKKYGAENPMQNKTVQDKAKKTNLERYGAENVFASEYGKAKIKSTNIERYSVENPMRNETVRDKTRKTSLERYGTDNPLKNETVRSKAENTCIEKYGVINPFYSEDIQNRIKAENLEKYGATYPFQSYEIQEKIRKSFLKKYGRPNFRFSNMESEVVSYIEEIYDGEIIKNDRSALRGKEIDIFIPELNIGFEINGDYWHMNPAIYDKNSFNGVIGKYASEIWKRDSEKIRIASEKNICLYIIWESEWKMKKDIVKDFIRKTISVNE